MAKIIDITNKLGFEEKPKLKIKEKEYEVDNSAVAMLKIMPKTENGTSKDMIDCMNILFKQEDIEEIVNLKDEKGNSFSLEDLITVIMTAIQLVTGESAEGETVTPATT